ncbi:hypothetical protein [Pedobacter caeni]|uniref:Uncharacterized protein n=1 Tax=Pedobacter caeni TaxID=288992 RepID=A0A1M5B6N0_9SPHI|nr:hypothetical protein [Pedobacter caeni]SHF38201.1 hypothetical protein SAMN04488522_1021051 [Pedobacter caeni]
MNNLTRFYLTFILSLSFSLSLSAQSLLQNAYWKLDLLQDGTLKDLKINRNKKWENIPLPEKEYKGFRWYLSEQNKEENIAIKRSSENTFTGNYKDIHFHLSYVLLEDKLQINAIVTNNSGKEFSPEKLGLRMGISNYMESYPQWNDVYFPTLLRAEKTHFWGYMMNPNGNILGLASPDPIASWSLNYNFGYGSKEVFFWGHRIYSSNLDLINTGPLPQRHPQNSSSLKPGQTKKWSFYLVNISTLEDVAKTLTKIHKAPSFEIRQTTLEKGKPFEVKVYNSGTSQLKLTAPSGTVKNIKAKTIKSGIAFFSVIPSNETGVYTLTANHQNRITEAKITVSEPWGWYLQKAREAALIYTQKASWNCENWYGFYSAYLAQIYYPNAEKLKQSNEQFSKVMSLMYDTVNAVPKKITNASRIQNTSTTIGILVDKYRALKNISDLSLAARLADHVIIPSQSADGAYRNGHTHYTSVIYIAKSILELAEAEKELGKTDLFWKNNYQKHYLSAKKAVDQLMLGMSAIETEGEGTFEDGMISCTALQIAAFALLQDNIEERNRYTKMAEDFINSHRSLTQLIVPDSRIRNGTLRFWEAQYDVMLGKNMLSSPHGWSAWRAYATHYLYLLTGKEDYLIQTMNAVGSCAQTIDSKSGKLRWAFVIDPYVNTVQSSENFPGTSEDKYNNNQFKAEEGKTKPIIIGEQYVDMVSDWFQANTSDNDVHEIFKCMEEVALGKAYVLERNDGTLLTYNCSVIKKGNYLVLNSADDRLFKAHFNLKKKCKVSIPGWKQETSIPAGISWFSKR